MTDPKPPTRIYVTFVEVDADIFVPLLVHTEADWELHGNKDCRAKIAAKVVENSTANRASDARTVCIVLPPGIPDSLFYPEIDASQCVVTDEKVTALTRCGNCPNCVKFERARLAVLRVVNWPRGDSCGRVLSHPSKDDDAVGVWNDAVRDFPCTTPAQGKPTT